ncbi:MAG: (Fe-S)-binding protein [Bacteroidetes bacterium]|nr:MAG: (Fe-S)-binding protein [Bacteroidota bacterium]
MGIANIIFLLLFIGAIVFFAFQVKKITRNIKLGKPLNRSDRKNERLKLMLKVALGQSKMVVRPVAGILHIIVYLGFIIINLEILEIIIDGIFGTHRVFTHILSPSLYTGFINIFEVLALGVLLACVIFLIRRNVLKIKRFWSKEMTSWPRTDANLILITEILLMTAFLFMNAADTILMNTSPQLLNEANLSKYANHLEGQQFIISSLLHPVLNGMSLSSLAFIERFTWWFHIIGVLAFLNYLPISKHFHIILAFPNVYFSKLKPKGQLNNLESVKKEVELMMDPNADPFAAPAPAEGEAPQKFGAKDVMDLTWVNLLNAYSCTECGRCTSECPANVTGKLLSPRKIMMDTRDRMEEVGKNIDKNGGKFVDDGKSLLHDYITEEELWACTTCNACAEACPINIDPVSIIIDLRRYLIMEESKAPQEWMMMSTNIENNGAPWQFSPTDRANWTQEL